MHSVGEMTLHDLLDWHYGEDSADRVRQMLADGADVNARSGPHDETPLHVAVRRYRRDPLDLLLAGGADIDAKTKGGKTAYVHAVRRGFDDLAELLVQRGSDKTLAAADRFAVAVVGGRLDEARQMLARQPGLARTGNPEEDRLLADVAGRNPIEPVALLLGAGADLTATGLDGGAALHQAAWFGQPANAQLLIDAGAELENFADAHESSPLGWVVHGSTFSGGAAERQDRYVQLVQMLLGAGARLHYPGEPENDRFYRRLLGDASPLVAAILRAAAPF